MQRPTSSPTAEQDRPAAIRHRRDAAGRRIPTPGARARIGRAESPTAPAGRPPRLIGRRRDTVPFELPRVLLRDGWRTADQVDLDLPRLVSHPVFRIEDAEPPTGQDTIPGRRSAPDHPNDADPAAGHAVHAVPAVPATVHAGHADPAAGQAGPQPRRPDLSEDLPADLGRPILLPTEPGRTELPDPAQHVAAPSRTAEPVLATATTLLAGAAALGTGAPTSVWTALSLLPAIGLLAMVRPGGDSARLVRATGVLAAAAAMAVIWPAMTPITVVAGLAVAATYPMLLTPGAGRSVIALAAVALGVPLLSGLDSGATPFLTHLLDGGGSGSVARLALGSAMLAAPLLGASAMATRKALTSTADLAIDRARNARAAGAQLSRASSCDPTTGLPNREALLRALTLAVCPDGGVRSTSDGSRSTGGDTRQGGGAQPSDGRVAVLVVDIDRFPAITDSLGPALAESVAVQVGRRLRGAHPDTQLVARIGRHQYAVLLPQASTDSAGSAARRLTTQMESPLTAGERQLPVTCSVGVALSGPGLDDADDLLQAADEAARSAARSGPERGRARWVMFDHTVRSHLHSQALLEVELRDAIRDSHVGLRFQPLLALAGGGDSTDRIVGVEALPTWIRTDGDGVPAERFLPMADDLGLGMTLGMQLLDQALDTLAGWQARDAGIDQVWVSLPARQVQDPDLPHQVAARLATRGLPASCLVLQLGAEQLADSEQTRSTLGMFRSLGIAVVLDGFGRSGTSLSALRSLPISAVKLDHSLGAELGRADDVPRAITTMCHSLSLRVVVEGVESALQLQGARQIRADAVQGFAVARPMSADQLAARLGGDPVAPGARS